MSPAIIGIVLASTLSVVAVAHLLPLVVALSAGDGGDAAAFAVTGLLTGFVAGALGLSVRGRARRARTGERLAALLTAWAVTPAFGALAFVGADPEILFADAYFDAVSAVTTTGAIAFQPGEPAAVMVWRATLQWIGGFAALMMAMVVLAPLGLAALSLRRAPIPPGNTSGPFGRYWPAMLALGTAYAAITLVGLAILTLAGMSPVAGLVLAFSATATGGLMPQDGALLPSLGLVPAMVAAALMATGATNYLRHAGLLRRRLADYRADPEIRYFAIALVVGGMVLALLMALAEDRPWSLSRGILWMVSLMSTSVHPVDTEGFDSIPFVLALAIVFVGGGTMATAGGLKLMRIALLAKQGAREIARLAHPHGIVHTEFAGRPFTISLMRGVWALFVLTIVLALTAAAVLTGFGMPFEQALAAGVGAVSNAGPVLGFAPGADGTSLGLAASETYAALPPAAKLVLCIVMIGGRVEVLALFAVFGASMSRKA